MHAIEIRKLSKTYRGKRGVRVNALKGLTLEIEKGEVFGFLGPNGAGKSTTIKALMGLIRPSAGTARIMGKDIASTDSRIYCGYLPENPAFYDYLSAEEYLQFVGKAFAMPSSLLREETEKVLKLLELWDTRKRPIRSFSKGMVQRLGIAQVLLHDPEIYILDEPMSGLDPLGRALVKDIIVELKKRGRSVFFSSHIIADVESVCDRVGIILQGELQSVERVETIMTRGVIGYHLTVRERGTEITSQRYVAKDEISEAMRETEAAGNEISLIEPKRKSLEDFFLDIVRGKGQ